MKKTLAILLLLLLAVGCGGDDSNNSETTNADNQNNETSSDAEGKDLHKVSASTPEEFARSVLALLAANDSDRFIEFVFPTKEELLVYIQEQIPADEQDEARKEINEEFAEKKESVLESFAEVRKRAALAGCNLGSASFGHCNTDVRPIQGDIDVIITESGKSYQFEIDDCLLMNGRWYNMDGLNWRRDTP